MLAAALLVGSEGTASAFQYEWTGLPIGGAATSIAVGPNNIPWVVGTDGNIYYLSVSAGGCGQGVLCQPTYAWTPVSGVSGATQVAVDLNGGPYVVDNAGRIYSMGSNCQSGVSLPAPWFQIPSSQPVSWLAGQSVIDVPPGQLPEFFLTACTSAPAANTPMLWAIGPHWPGYQGYIYEDPVDWNQSTRLDTAYNWQQVDPVAAPSGLTITLFNNPGPPATQTPWVTTNNQVLLRWDSSEASFVQAPGLGSILTDHFVVGTDGNVYEWDDSIENWQPPPVAGPTPGGAIGGLAYSGPIEGTFDGTIGPSALWAFDANTQEIYYAIQPLPPPR